MRYWEGVVLQDEGSGPPTCTAMFRRDPKGYASLPLTKTELARVRLGLRIIVCSARPQSKGKLKFLHHLLFSSFFFFLMSILSLFLSCQLCRC